MSKNRFISTQSYVVSCDPRHGSSRLGAVVEKKTCDRTSAGSNSGLAVEIYVWKLSKQRLPLPLISTAEVSMSEAINLQGPVDQNLVVLGSFRCEVMHLCGCKGEL